MGIAPDSILGVAVSTVTDKINDLDALGSKYSSLLQQSLTNISGIKVADVAAPTRPDIPIASPPPITLGPIPSYSPPALVIPAMPAGLNIDDLLSDLDVGDMGGIPDAPVSIPIQIPEAPSMAAIPVCRSIAAAG